METQYWERPLTAGEIADRTKHLIEMLSDAETLDGIIEDHKRSVRAYDVKKKGLEFQIGTTRREIQRGFVYEPRQVKINFVDPETPETPTGDIVPGTLADADGNPVADPRPEARPAEAPANDGATVCIDCALAEGHAPGCTQAPEALIGDAEPVETGPVTLDPPAQKPKRKRATKKKRSRA